jgi:hypothetical protein
MAVRKKRRKKFGSKAVARRRKRYRLGVKNGSTYDMYPETYKSKLAAKKAKKIAESFLNAFANEEKLKVTILEN